MKALQIIGFSQEKPLSGAFGGPSRAHVGHKVRGFWLGVWTWAQGGLRERTVGRKEGTWSSFGAIFFFFGAPARLSKSLTPFELASSRRQAEGKPRVSRGSAWTWPP